MPPLPPLSPSLVSSLEEIFKPLNINPSHDLPRIYYNAGEQNVIRFLKRKLEEQEREGLSL